MMFLSGISNPGCLPHRAALDSVSAQLLPRISAAEDAAILVFRSALVTQGFAVAYDCVLAFSFSMT